MALCLALHQAGVPFTALHFNHNLRPESDSEEAWLQQTCRQLDIPFHSQKWPSFSKAGSLQQNARQARYDFFKQAANTLQLRHIMTAHTADDVAETTLMRLFYGSGTAGLASMAQDRSFDAYTLHRPLLSVNRNSLRQYLKAHNQIWLEDPSNYKVQHVRVRARYWLEKLPPEITEALIKFASSCRQLEQSLQQQLAPYEDYIIKQPNNWAVINTAVLALPDYARQRLFKDVFRTLRPDHHLPRTQKQTRLFEVLQKPEASHSLGHIQFRREGQKIIARAMDQG